MVHSVQTEGVREGCLPRPRDRQVGVREGLESIEEQQAEEEEEEDG